ncbi:MAG TPA: hypothetical protein VF278_25030 [Pirellulales bacterium]
MSAIVDTELGRFHRFIAEQLNAGLGSVSPEEALDLWRLSHPIAEAKDEDILAVQEALDDMENGDGGVPLDRFDREFRRRQGLEAK